jgi:hypothetical protein
MRRLALAAALFAAPFLGKAESGLAASLERARAEFASASAAEAAAEAAAAPLAESVRALKAVNAPWWWTRWRLRSKLASLQESLDRLRETRARQESARQELFLVLSALEEELRSALNRELSRPKASAPRVQGLFARKVLLDSELEGMGFGEGKPFPLVDEPGGGAAPWLRADRQKALQARAIQLEAWNDTVGEDLRLVRRARERGAMEAGVAGQRLLELEALARRIGAMIGENETMLSKN